MPLVKFVSTNQKHYPDLGSKASSYGISALVSQTSFRGETSGGVTKCQVKFAFELICFPSTYSNNISHTKHFVILILL